MPRVSTRELRAGARRWDCWQRAFLFQPGFTGQLRRCALLRKLRKGNLLRNLSFAPSVVPGSDTARELYRGETSARKGDAVTVGTRILRWFLPLE